MKIQATALSMVVLKSFEAAIAVKSSDCTLNNPPPRQQFKPFGSVGSLDDLQGPCPDLGQSDFQLGSSIAAVREDVAKPGKERANGSEERRGAIAVLDIGGMTMVATSKPLVSVNTCRLRPLMHLSAS